jgi:hypothetical protein
MLEVMIATAIMASAIVAVLELFGGSLRLAGDAGHQSQALVLARALVDEEMWRDKLQDGQRQGVEGQFSWTVVTHPTDRELVGRDENQDETHSLAGDFGLWEIDADVTWQTPLGEKSIHLQTARMGQRPDQDMQ